MKAYKIESAEQLKEIVQLMKYQKDKDRTAAYAKVWSVESRKADGKAGTMSARLEIGRNAQLFKVVGETVSLLGVVNLSMARAFVSEMEAIK